MKPGAETGFEAHALQCIKKSPLDTSNLLIYSH
jgi:hypothetical protein